MSVESCHNNFYYRAGFVIMTTIVVMVRMRVNSVIHNTRLAPHRNSHVKTSNVSEINIAAMVKMTVVIIQMKWAARKIILLVPLDNLPAQMDSVLITTWCAIKFQIVPMNRMNHFIATLMNVPKLKYINVDINVSILLQAIIAIVIKDTSKFFARIFWKHFI